MKIKAIYFFLITVFILTVFASCSDDPDSGKALLLSFKIGDVAADVIPVAITNADWADDEFAHAMDPEKTSRMFFFTANDLTDKSISWTISPGAKAEYGIPSSVITAPESYTNNKTATFIPGQFVVVKVTSQDGSTVRYYRFGLLLKSEATHLSGITVSGVEGTLGLSAPAFNQVSNPGIVNITSTQGAIAEVLVTKGVEGQTIRYARIPNSFTMPSWTDNNIITALSDGNFICLQVTAENGVNRAFYMIQVQMGRLARIEAVTIGNNPETFFIGIPNVTWDNVWPPRTEPYNANDTPTSRRVMPFFTGVQPAGGFTFSVTSSVYSTAQYAKLNSMDDPMPASFGPGPIFFENGNVLAIRVTSENGQNHIYYKIPLRIPAVTITKQPDTAPLIYHVGETPKTLSIEVQGDYDVIQWVYFNSWGAPINPAFNSNPQGPDELIISNQGFIIEGATGLTYTPDTSVPLTHRYYSNFGTSADPAWQYHEENFARYVAARVSKAGFSDVFSDRVLVHVLPTDQIKDFVLDLSGLEIKLGPFTGSYQNMVFDLPEGTFPADFDIMNYSRITASAIKYSKNGERIRQDSDKANFGLMNGAAAIKACYNLGMGDNGRGNNTTNNSLLHSNEDMNNGAPVLVTPTGVRLGTAGVGNLDPHYPEYIQLVELRFSGPSRE